MSVGIQTCQILSNHSTLEDTQGYRTSLWKEKRRVKVPLKPAVTSFESVIKLEVTLRNPKTMVGDTFITYTHPEQQYDKKNRRKVASYIGTHYRNRSRPAERNAAQTDTVVKSPRSGSTSHPRPNEQYDRQLVVNQQYVPTNVHRDRSGLRTDPFTTYPIKSTKCVPGAIDYCMSWAQISPHSLMYLS